MPEINSKRVQNKNRQKKARQENAKKAKKSGSRSNLNANITWESKEEKLVEEKTSNTTLYKIFIGLFLLFLFVLWAFVEDRPTILAREKAREREEARRNASNSYQSSNTSRKLFAYESSVIFNSTQLSSVLTQLSDPISELDRIVMVAFDDSTGEAAGDILKVKLFRKMEAVAKAMPRKKVFQRYEEEELPMIGLFDCGNTNDAHAENVCKELIHSKTPNVLIFRRMSKPRVLPQEYRSDNQIIAYLHSLMQPAVTFLDERNECEDFVTNDKYLNVVLFGTDETSVFEAVADSLRDFARFGKTKNPSTAEAFFAQIPSILAWRTFGENPVTFAGNMSDAQSIHSFVLNQYLPALGEFNERTQSHYMKRGLPIVWIAYDQTDDATENLLKVSEEVAGRYMGALSFVKLEVSEQPKIAENLGLKKPAKGEGEEGESAEQKGEEPELPQVLIMNQLANLKLPIDTEDIEGSINAVVNEYFQKLRSSRAGPGDVQSELEDMEEYTGEEAMEDDDEVDIETENVDSDSQGVKEEI